MSKAARLRETAVDTHKGMHCIREEPGGQQVRKGTPKTRLAERAPVVYDVCYNFQILQVLSGFSVQ